METRAHHVLIGLFTVLVVGAALMFALWLGKSDADRQFEIYDIVFQEAVSGLSKGGTVEFNGIKIGDVVSLRLDPDDARRVIARVRVDAAAPVRTDTEARLVPAGITGLTMIRLTSGDDPGSVPLQAEDDVVPRLVAVPSAFGRLLADGEDAVTNVNELLVQARMLFSAENVAAIGRTLDNLEQTTAALAAQRDDVNAVLKQVTQASVEASMTSAMCSTGVLERWSLSRVARSRIQPPARPSRKEPQPTNSALAAQVMASLASDSCPVMAS